MLLLCPYGCADVASYSQWAGSPPLCVLCNGWFATDEEAYALTSLLASAGVNLRMYMPQADPGRRDLARMLVSAPCCQCVPLLF